MKKILLIALVFVLSSCVKTKTYKDKLQVHHENLEPQEITIKKYNDALFSIDTAHFAEGLKAIKDDYMVFLGGDLDDADAVAYLKAFAVDTLCIRLNKMVQKKFSDDSELKKEIKAVYQRLNYYSKNHQNVSSLVVMVLQAIDIAAIAVANYLPIFWIMKNICASVFLASPVLVKQIF